MSLLDKWSRFAHDKWWWKWIVNFLGNIRLYWGGVILFGSSSYKIKGSDMRFILETIEPGDVLLRNYQHYFSSIMIPGYWSHAAMYVGDLEGKPNRVIHMLGHGICNEDLLTFMRCDQIAILRPKDPEMIERAIIIALKYLDSGTDYDYGFIRGDTNLYCSELIWHCYGKPQDVKFDKYILPDNLQCEFFDTRYDSTVHKNVKKFKMGKTEELKETPFVTEEKKDEVDKPEK
jgi:hypothetical protein